MFDKFTLQNLADKENNIMRRCSFIIQTSDKNSFFCPIQVFNCAIFFFTILQDKLYSFYIQDDRNTRFLCTRNYCIDLTPWSLLRRCFIIRFVLFEDMGEREARERAADLFFIARARGALRN